MSKEPVKTLITLASVYISKAVIQRYLLEFFFSLVPPEENMEGQLSDVTSYNLDDVEFENRCCIKGIHWIMVLKTTKDKVNNETA